MTAQRYYRVEHHIHGKGRWTMLGPVHPSRHHATVWAQSKGWIEREDAVAGSREKVYRIVEVHG